MRELMRGLASAAIASLTLLASLDAAHAADSDLDPTQSLAEFDQSLERFRRDIWNVQRLTAMFGRDLRGRMLNDDLRDFVFTKETESNLQKERTQIDRQIRVKPAAAKQSLNALKRLLADESARLDEIFMHRLRHRQVAYQRDLWRSSANRSPNYKPPPAIDRLEQEAVVRLNAGEFAEVANRVYPALQRAYVTERNELALNQRMAPDSVYYSRKTPCGEPARSTSGKSVPTLSSRSPPVYPDESRRAGEEGNVLMNVLVSATGCATSFAIASTSGWFSLDDAALDWLETTKFLPAEQDGKATAIYVMVPVNFKLDD